jgi:FtsP/CotA-like multicopper oxidase with cupredoxin domain
MTRSLPHLKLNRRQLCQAGLIGGASILLPWRSAVARSTALASNLSDPASQPKFVNVVPNPIDPAFRYVPVNGEYTVGVGPTVQQTGLVNPGGKKLDTPLFGYGQDGVYTWPGKSFEVQSGGTTTIVNWENNLFGEKHLLPVDTSLHWAYSLHGYEGYSINKDGIPVVTHVHGGHTDFQFDGNPEYFYTPGSAIVGPQWANVPGGFTNRFVYDNDVPAGNLWYHDHALGITRLNVYAGMAGFYFVRDAMDTGLPGNPLGLPAYPYELGLAIQDRMFGKNGRLFYPAFPSDPFWADFISGEGLFNGDVPKPSALAEFFGDHTLVNGLIWPKADVQPRHYRLRLLNGCDSRFLVLRFRAVSAGATSLDYAGAPLPFYVIGSDQGLASSATLTDTLVHEPGGRYDVVFDFKGLQGKRIILENIGGDAPFGGDFGNDLDPLDLFPDRQTDRIMAFDVAGVPDVADAFDPLAIGPYTGNVNPVIRTRKVALFEGNDEYGRLQPLLGTAEPTVDANGNVVDGALTWAAPSTENPDLAPDAAEIWEIYNATGDAHPVHLHLVQFEVLDRQLFMADAVEQPVVQHNGSIGIGFRLENIVPGPVIPTPAGYVENAPKDMVTALPGQITRIKTTFDKPGRYVWHCHILSHEDHEMMRVMQVGG